MQIRWKKLNNYCIEFSELTICKYKTIDSERFIIWHENKILKIFDAAKEAKEYAMDYYKTKLAVSD